MERLCAVERSRQGADGSSPSGRQSPGAPWGTNARTASSVERTPVARLRPVARTPALRSPLGCSALLPTPLRRAPRGGPMHSGLPDSASPHSSTPALLPTAPPFQKSAANRSPALRTPAMRALRPAADPPTALRPSALRSSARKSVWQQCRRPQRAVFGDKRLSSESNPRPPASQPST